MKALPLICVVWDDAHGDSVMFDEHDVQHKPYRFTSVGFLVRSDEVGISIAGEIGEDGRLRDHAFIPRAMVVTEWLIGPLRQPRRQRSKDVPPCPPSSSSSSSP